MDDVERQFLEAITRDPEDEGARTVYADWLEERGDPRGEYLRLELQLQKIPRRLAELAPAIDESWLEMIVRRFDVRLCEPGPNKIAAIKEVRAITGLGLKDAKDIIDRASTMQPQTVISKVPREVADKIAYQLAGTGATYEIVGHYGGRVVAPIIWATITIHAVSAPHKLHAIKLVREVIALGLKDTKDLVERVIAGKPEVLPKRLPIADAQRFIHRFGSFGEATSDL